MTSWLRGMAGATLLLFCGCARTSFNETDLGTTVEVDQGSDFSISLQRVPSGERKAPEIRGALVRLLDRRVDSGTEYFRFTAEGVGEAEIRIPGKDQSVPEFVLQVRVLRAAGAGASHRPAGPQVPGY